MRLGVEVGVALVAVFVWSALGVGLIYGAYQVAGLAAAGATFFFYEWISVVAFVRGTER